MLDPIFTAGLLSGLLVALLIIGPCLPLYRQRVSAATCAELEARFLQLRWERMQRQLAAGDPALAWVRQLEQEEEHTPSA